MTYLYKTEELKLFPTITTHADEIKVPRQLLYVDLEKGRITIDYNLPMFDWWPIPENYPPISFSIYGETVITHIINFKIYSTTHDPFRGQVTYEGNFYWRHEFCDNSGIKKLSKLFRSKNLLSMGFAELKSFRDNNSLRPCFRSRYPWGTVC